MVLEELKEKAAMLPLVPGVYLMHDKSGQVIYVGKAKKLRNRVSQYFLNTSAHTPKTKLMVSKVFDFEVIVAGSEFEALVLECSLIKRYLPKYNILLKDDKGYPYLRLDDRLPYPRLEMVSKIADDKAEYYGPYGSRGVTQNLLESICSVFKLPTCSKKLPQDIGKERPCLQFHMNQCAGWCQASMPQTAYKDAIGQVRKLLSGQYKDVVLQMKEEMLQAADELNFELAASLRDKVQAIETLGKRQLVTAGTLADTDIIGFTQTETRACFTILHFSCGNLIDKEYEILSVQEDPSVAISSLLKQYYLSRGYAPKRILLPMEIDDGLLFEELLLQKYDRKVSIRVPQRGDNAKLIALANTNALEEAKRVTNKEERAFSSVRLLEKMLSIKSAKRIESFDISNLSGTDIVASMVVFQDGRALKGNYKHFKLENMDMQDDYAAMYQVISRRFTHFIANDKGFEVAPDLLLIDGGATHAAVAERALQEMNLQFPVFGMVKDDRHRTRALITSEGNQIEIVCQQAVYALIGSIQEETHRFAISYHRKLRSKRLKYSKLDAIPGIGPKRKEDLLKAFRSIAAIEQATIPELERVLPRNAAQAVFDYFRDRKGREEVCE